MTVARRILIHVALGAAVVLAVVAGVTYYLVYEQAEARAVDQLTTYVRERTQLEEARFETIYNNQEIVKGLILQRDLRPVPDDVDAQWDKLFVKDPDGAWRSRKEVCDPLHNSSLWMHKDFPQTPRKRWQVLNAFNVTNELMPMWEKNYPSCFVMFPENACTGFNPMQPSWVWDTPADYPLIDPTSACCATSCPTSSPTPSNIPTPAPPSFSPSAAKPAKPSSRSAIAASASPRKTRAGCSRRSRGPAIWGSGRGPASAW
jgi:hypothetical protein